MSATSKLLALASLGAAMLLCGVYDSRKESATMDNTCQFTAKEAAIVDISAWTARGEQDKLGAPSQEGRYGEHSCERQALAWSRA